MSDLFAIELKFAFCLLPFAFCLFVNRPCFIISCMDKPSSSIKARILGIESDIITPNRAASAAGMPDMAGMLEGFATRPPDAFLTKKHLQALAR